MSEFPSVSVVIRARNEADLIGECLKGIASQDYKGQVEILLIDSGSTDATLEIAKGFSQVRILEIPPKEFNYGGTLNLGITESKGDLIIALSAHCVPVHQKWLSALVAPLLLDSSAAGSFGRQIPWPHADLWEAKYLNVIFPTTDKVFSGIEYYTQPLDVLYSNANSCFRRMVALNNPFPRLAWAEDRIWGHRVLSKGYSLHYAANAAVFHSHQRSVKGYFNTGRQDGRMRRQLKMRKLLLSSAEWYGFKIVYWKWLTCLRCIPNKKGRISDSLSATILMLKLIAFDLGRCFGEQGW